MERNVSADWNSVRHVITNNYPHDPFNVSIIAKRNRVAGWSVQSLEHAEMTAAAWLKDHPEHSYAKINCRRFDRSAK